MIALCVAQSAHSIHLSENTGHGRYERRRVSVWVVSAECLRNEFPEGWVGLRRVIKVERWRTVNGQEHYSEQYYISSVRRKSAEYFGQAIRGHWRIENQLHWIKDVMLREDARKWKTEQGAVAFAILATLIVNAYRLTGTHSVTYARAAFGGNVKKLATILL